MPKPIHKFDPKNQDEYDLSGDDTIFEKVWKYIKKGIKVTPPKNTLASTRKKQGPGFWQADIGE